MNRICLVLGQFHAVRCSEPGAERTAKPLTKFRAVGFSEYGTELATQFSSLPPPVVCSLGRSKRSVFRVSESEPVRRSKLKALRSAQLRPDHKFCAQLGTHGLGFR
eukprot:CAMPEP_0181066484 /NCGR_PEP_ID=MMETSP1070-20121207/25356_1 /TAXON_ID=265543 /ORGANISM="Minutocellus polymorphus, Strain NH13" /LENGTH=105 /DNA_ID=CAMNT_0023147063 /DNA_START=300 /DNA_END=615 /DNA_ORIENTATION=+